MNLFRHSLGLLALAATLSTILLPTSASAQQPDVAQATRFSTMFVPEGTRERVHLSIMPEGNGHWQVRVTASNELGPKRLRERIPDWVVEEHYDFQISSAPINRNTSAVILTALPGGQGDAPPSATQFQVVWLVSTRGQTPTWSRLDTAQFSTLDGGQRFELRPDGQFERLIRLQRDEDSIFCGAQSSEPVLYDEFNLARGQFEQTLDMDSLLEDAPVLASAPAPRDFTPPALQAWHQWFAASSDRRSPNRRGALIRPLELGDRRYDTGWTEGVDGLGRGEFVSAQVSDAAALESIRIVPGLGGSRAAYEAFAKPTRLLIGVSDGSRYVVEVPQVAYEDISSGRGVLVRLPEVKKTRCMSIMLLDAERGRPVRGQPSWARNAVAITEISPYSELHAEDAQATARRIVERIAQEEDARARRRIAELVLPLEEELVDEVERALRQGSPIERRRIIPLLGHLPAHRAVPTLLGFLKETEPQAPEYRAIKRSLATHYGEAAPALVAFLNVSPPDDERKHTDMLRLLGRVGQPAHLATLIERLGQGNESVRNERIRAVGAGGAPLVEPVLEYARWHVNTAGGYDALRVLNLIAKRLHYTGQGELPRPEYYSAILQETDDRRTLMHALRVAKFFEVDDFIPMVDNRYTKHDDPLVRRAAIDALERYNSTRARSLLVDALADTSPDVRIAAVVALSERDDVDAALPSVVAYARSERWKPGLQQAFRLLANVEDERTDTVFEELFRERPNEEVALLAAQALDRAGRPVRTDLARAVVTDTSINFDLRQEMVDLLGLDDSRLGEEFLLSIIVDERWRTLAMQREAQERLRDRTLLSLGRRRSAAAKPLLLDLVREGESSAVQQTSLRALAFYQDEELLSALRQWRKNADPRLHSVADQTITMIERRRTIEQVREEIGDVVEEDQDNSESNRPGDASND